MADHYFIRMGTRPDEAETVAVNAEGQILEAPQTIPLSLAAERANGYSVTVLLPGDELVTTVANVPAASPARLRQMLPYSLEDDFAADVDDLHFAAGSRNSDDLLAVTVIAKSRLDFWREALVAAGITARHVCAETDGVPDIPGTVTLLVERDRVLGRSPGAAPFVFSDMSLPDLWRLLETERKDESDIDAVVLLVDAAQIQARQQEIEELRAGVENLEVKSLPDGCLPRLAATLVSHPGPNLLQGAYATRSNLRAVAAPWRLAASLLVAVLGFGVLSQAAVYFKLRQNERSLDEQAVAICTQSFGTQDLSRCRIEMGRRLASAGQTATSATQGFLPTLSAVAESAEGLSIQRINYGQSVLNLEVLAPSIEHLDAFQRRVGDTDQFSARIQNNRAEDDGAIRSRLQVVSGAQ